MTRQQAESLLLKRLLLHKDHQNTVEHLMKWDTNKDLGANAKALGVTKSYAWNLKERYGLKWTFRAGAPLGGHHKDRKCKQVERLKEWDPLT